MEEHQCVGCKQWFPRKNLILSWSIHPATDPSGYRCQNCQTGFVARRELRNANFEHDRQPHRARVKCALRRHIAAHEQGRSSQRAPETAQGRLF